MSSFDFVCSSCGLALSTPHERDCHAAGCPSAREEQFERARCACTRFVSALLAIQEMARQPVVEGWPEERLAQIERVATSALEGHP